MRNHIKATNTVKIISTDHISCLNRTLDDSGGLSLVVTNARDSGHSRL